MRAFSAAAIYLFSLTAVTAALPKEAPSVAPAPCATCPDFNQRWIYHMSDRPYSQLNEKRLLDYARSHDLVAASFAPDIKPRRKTGRIALMIVAGTAGIFALLLYFCFRRYNWRDMS